MSAPWSKPGPVATALGLFVVSVADSKFFLGRRVAEWCVGAPELESAVACAAVAQEELGHARVLYPLLTDLPLQRPLAALEREDDREECFCPGFLRRRWETWPESVVGLAVTDTALTTVLESVTSSLHEELARRACRIVEEERFHAVFAWGRLRALLQEPGGSQTQRELVLRVEEVTGWLSELAQGWEVLRASGVADAEGLPNRFLSRVQGELAPFRLRNLEIPGVR